MDPSLFLSLGTGEDPGNPGAPYQAHHRRQQRHRDTNNPGNHPDHRYYGNADRVYAVDGMSGMQSMM